MSTALRCFCHTKPILAMIKHDDSGAPFVHIKIYKAGRIFGEILFDKGKMRVRCRECYRWHVIRITKQSAQLEDVPDDRDIVDLVPDPS